MLILNPADVVAPLRIFFAATLGELHALFVIE
jgi:hypothetical protein